MATSLYWQRRIDAASSQAAVISLAGEFLAVLSPVDIARLPDYCRPGPMARAQDLVDYGLVLVRHRCGDDVATQRLVTRLASFFSAATIRLSQLGTPSGVAGRPVENADSDRLE
jgi:hypothetical protein